MVVDLSHQQNTQQRSAKTPNVGKRIRITKKEIMGFETNHQSNDTQLTEKIPNQREMLQSRQTSSQSNAVPRLTNARINLQVNGGTSNAHIYEQNEEDGQALQPG